MYKTLLFALLLPLSSPWVQALQSPSPEENKAATSPAGLTTIEGCLQYDEGEYSLIDKDGMKYRLAGAGKQLKPQVQHQVELTGKPSSRTIDNTPPGGASSVIQRYVFEVKSVKRTAENCRTY